MSQTPRHDYQAGQVWSYATRPGEEQSRLYIVKAETPGNGGPIFHVCIDGIGIPNARLPGGVQTQLPHAPVSLQTLDASVTTLVGSTDTPPDITEGYNAWRAAYDAGDAGVFTISIAEIVDFIDQIVRQQQGVILRMQDGCGDMGAWLGACVLQDWGDARRWTVVFR